MRTVRIVKRVRAEEKNRMLRSKRKNEIPTKRKITVWKMKKQHFP